MSYELFQLFVTETTWNHTTLIICFKKSERLTTIFYSIVNNNIIHRWKVL